jgi:hypothetical protein
MASEHTLKAALMECALIISSFKNRNSQAGYPLREPPGSSAIISTIDALVNTDAAPEKATPKKSAVVRRRKLKPLKVPPLSDTEAGREMLARGVDSVRGGL